MTVFLVNRCHQHFEFFDDRAQFCATTPRGLQCSCRREPEDTDLPIATVQRMQDAHDFFSANRTFGTHHHFSSVATREARAPDTVSYINKMLLQFVDSLHEWASRLFRGRSVHKCNESAILSRRMWCRPWPAMWTRQISFCFRSGKRKPLKGKGCKTVTTLHSLQRPVHRTSEDTNLPVATAERMHNVYNFSPSNCEFRFTSLRLGPGPGSGQGHFACLQGDSAAVRVLRMAPTWWNLNLGKQNQRTVASSPPEVAQSMLGFLSTQNHLVAGFTRLALPISLHGRSEHSETVHCRCQPETRASPSMRVLLVVSAQAVLRVSFGVRAKSAAAIRFLCWPTLLKGLAMWTRTARCLHHGSHRCRFRHIVWTTCWAPGECRDSRVSHVDRFFLRLC